MGIFSTNSRPSLAEYEVLAAEGYGGPGAGYKVMVECYQNDMALFNGLIQHDFNEAYAGINESYEVVTEGAVGDFFKKLKEFFLKLIEKIKGIIKSFMTKFIAVFIRDNKELVKKYHKQVVKNLNDNKLKEMPFKAHKGFLGFDVAKANFVDTGIYEETFKEFYGANKTAEQMRDYKEKHFDNNEALLAKLGVSEINEFEKEFVENAIGEVEEFEGYTDAMNTKIEGILTTGANVLKGLKDAQTKAEKVCKKNISLVDKAHKEFIKIDQDKTYDWKTKSGDTEITLTRTGETGSALTALLYQAALADQTYMTKFTNVVISTYKTVLKECRATYVKAASFRGVKEDALMGIIDEASNYEVDMVFESAGYVDVVDDEEIENTINQDVADIADEEV